MTSSTTTHVLVIGAGAAAWCGALPALLAAAQRRRLAVTVFDRGVLTAGHLAHRTIYPAPQRCAGQPKAEVFAARLRQLGIAATARCGNATRWPLAEFRADLALVGLDDEAARGALHRQLRRAATPALFLGLADVAAVHSFGPGFDEPCYECLGQGQIPVAPAPCVPAARRPSTRLLCTAAARGALARALPDLCEQSLTGRGRGRYHVLPAAGGALSAALPRDPECHGWHGWHGRHEADTTAAIDAIDGTDALDAATAGRADVPTVHRATVHLATVHLDATTTLRAAFARCAAAWSCSSAAGSSVAGSSVAGSSAAAVELRGATIRGDYCCPDCGRVDLHGGQLVRAWPARERCPCGSLEVRPLLTLTTIRRDEAARLGLLDHSLGALGMPPGAELHAVPVARFDAAPSSPAPSPTMPRAVTPALRVRITPGAVLAQEVS